MKLEYEKVGVREGTQNGWCVWLRSQERKSCHCDS